MTWWVSSAEWAGPFESPDLWTYGFKKEGVETLKQLSQSYRKILREDRRKKTKSGWTRRVRNRLILRDVFEGESPLWLDNVWAVAAKTVVGWRTPESSGFLQADFIAAALHVSAPQAAAVKATRIQTFEVHPSHLNWICEGELSCQQGHGGREAVTGRAFCWAASLARLFHIGPEHLRWLCFLFDTQPFDLQQLGLSFI